MKQSWVAHLRWTLGREEWWEIYVEFGEGVVTEAMDVLQRHLESLGDVLPIDIQISPITTTIT